MWIKKCCIRNAAQRARKEELEELCIAKFMVTFFQCRGVLECFRYGRSINGELFSKFARNMFPHIFRKDTNQKGKLFLQDRGPSQMSKMSQNPWKNLFPQFPDINPIKNIFHLVEACLRKDAIKKKIKTEICKLFWTGVTNTLYKFPSDIIDRAVASMPK